MVRHQSPSVTEKQSGTPEKQDTAASSRIRSRRATEDPISRTESRGRSFSLRRVATTMLTPEKEIGPAPGVFRSIREILTNSCKFKFTRRCRPRRLTF